jgi:hypothetical protein
MDTYRIRSDTYPVRILPFPNFQLNKTTTDTFWTRVNIVTQPHLTSAPPPTATTSPHAHAPPLPPTAAAARRPPPPPHCAAPPLPTGAACPLPGLVVDPPPAGSATQGLKLAAVIPQRPDPLAASTLHG